MLCLVSESPEPLGAQRWDFLAWASFAGNRPPYCSCQQWKETDPTVVGLCSASCPPARRPGRPSLSASGLPCHPSRDPRPFWPPGLLCPYTCVHHKDPLPPTSSPTPGSQKPNHPGFKGSYVCSWHDEKVISLHVKGKRLRYIWLLTVLGMCEPISKGFLHSTWARIRTNDSPTQYHFLPSVVCLVKTSSFIP